MSRALDEWVGKTPDEAIPPRVKERIARKAEDRCLHCTLEIKGKLRAEIDHAIPLIMGGPNRESNLQLLCHVCHAAKTGRDVEIKSRVAAGRLKKLGIRKRSTFACSRDSRFKKKINGEVVLR
jgi:5-methylcytosine-specific restriction endonuclease McrA